MAKPSKRLRGVLEKVEGGKLYSLDEALQLVKGGATAKFDESVHRLPIRPTMERVYRNSLESSNYMPAFLLSLLEHAFFVSENVNLRQQFEQPSHLGDSATMIVVKGPKLKAMGRSIMPCGAYGSP